VINEFDVVIVGGGHAGIEAARALSACGFNSALVTLEKNKIGSMSCNPAIGGVAKGHLVHEIDALGGLMGACADYNAIQRRRLNMKKGPAVRATRVQCDKKGYCETMVSWVSNLPNLTIIEDECTGLLFDKNTSGDNVVKGIELSNSKKLFSKTVAITSGTFLKSVMYCGKERVKGGRFGDGSADKISESLIQIGHSLVRLKTGTPPRLDTASINYSKLEAQGSDSACPFFSWRTIEGNIENKFENHDCFITYTNSRTHNIISENLEESPLFSGDISGIGPRYCPSIEDKVNKFPDRLRHQIFLEPEGVDTNFIYPNGLSTSLSKEIQESYMRTIPGLERVILLRPGYAVEYDAVNPRDLHSSLMSKHCEGLFFAGQINRTSGYEEAAAQGIWAGMNIAQYLRSEDFITPDRSRSYIEVLIDDLVNLGTNEPYRLFTSRAEYRLFLREDNASERLFELGLQIGVLSKSQIAFNEQVSQKVTELKSSLKEKRIKVGKDRSERLIDYLKRPENSLEQIITDNLASIVPKKGSSNKDYFIFKTCIDKIEVETKYKGYIDRQIREINKFNQIKKDFYINLDSVLEIPALSNEEREKIKLNKPQSFFDLKRISGITPSSVMEILRQRKKPLSRAKV